MKREWDIPPLNHTVPEDKPEREHRVITGPIHNHTRRLTKVRVIEIVEEWVDLALGADFTVTLVHVADADESTILTRAIRDWRDGAGQREEFQQEIDGRFYWFGVRYQRVAEDAAQRGR